MVIFCQPFQVANSPPYKILDILLENPLIRSQRHEEPQPLLFASLLPPLDMNAGF